jgi:hypothetical protein
MDIRLNFINRADDPHHSQLLIFARNPETSLDEIAAAWTVIADFRPDMTYAVLYPADTGINVQDSFGNFTPMLPAEAGRHFRVMESEDGMIVELADDAGPPDQIILANALRQGAVNVGLYKDKRLYLGERHILPEQTAAFRLKPTLWVGVASQSDPDAGRSSAILSSVATEISLLGLASADIVMTGGGAGANAGPLVFTLENIVTA